jgi:LysM repeat protein
MSRKYRFIAGTVLAAVTLTAPSISVTAASPSTYVVKPGDSLLGIARRLEVPVGDLLSANGLTLTSTILPGQQLQVPGAAAPVATTGGSYTVAPGDSLSRIAQRHGVSLSALLGVNGFTASSLIVPGQSITLPAGATAPAAPAAPAAPPTGGSYAVRAGDSLGGIARRHGVSLSALLGVNGFTASSLIVPGQSITLPAGATAPAAPAAPAAPPTGGSYAVRAGDSLARIAQRYGVTLDALLRVNGFSASSLIVPGQSIALPAGAAPQAPTATPTGTSVDAAVNWALAQQGKPYQFFTAGPASFDCSGLTKAAYAQIGVTLIHQSASQARQGRAVDFMNEPIQAGDLIFLITRDNEVINHVGMAISSTQWIHAPGTGQAVRVGSIPSKSVITAVRRYV